MMIDLFAAHGLLSKSELTDKTREIREITERQILDTLSPKRVIRRSGHQS